MKKNLSPMLLTLLLLLFVQSGSAQSTEFTYQGRLLFGDVPANGSYDFEFALFDADSGGNQLGTTFPLSAVNVNNGVFSVRVDFGNQFPGSSRFLEIHVKQTGSATYSVLSPRQAISSAPYAIKSLNASSSDTATNATQLGGVNAGQFVITSDTRLSDARSPLPNSSNYIQNGSAQQSSSNFNITGTGSANILAATTQFNLAGNRILFATGFQNLFVGGRAGEVNTGNNNAFVGFAAGLGNTTGGSNAFFGNASGVRNTTGSANSFFGSSAGANSTTSSFNSFFGSGAGANSTGIGNSFFGNSVGLSTTTGGDNTFFGREAGINNTTGSSNTVIGARADIIGASQTFSTALGAQANINGDGLAFATALGAGAVVSASNTVVLGRSLDGVVIPGSLSVNGTSSADTLAAAAQFNLGGNRILFATGFQNLFIGGRAGEVNTGSNNAFVGYAAGLGNTAGGSNAFFGNSSGVHNTTGNANSFFGFAAGSSTSTSSFNSFFGSNAGANSTGIGNSFFGNSVGLATTTGGNNTFFGRQAGSNNMAGSNNTAIGALADFGQTGLNFATAVGAGASVSASNSVVLGRSVDAVIVPGSLTVNGILNATLPANNSNYIWNSTTQQSTGNFNIGGNGTAAGTLSANIVTATAQFNIGATRAVRSDFNGVAIGRNAWASDGGDANAFVGQDAGFANTGSNNAFLGDSAGQSNSSGSNNAFVGNGAGFANTTGSGNSFFGNFAGGNTTGSNNTLIGTTAATSSSNLTFATALGANAAVSTSDTIVLGKVAGTYGGVSRPADTVIARGLLQLPSLGAAGSTALCRNASNQISTCSSSIRYKTNISSFPFGLDLIRRLRPVSFNWKADGMPDVGLVAEDVNRVEPLLTTRNEKGEVEGVKYDRVGVVLINAVNEQQVQIENQQKTISDQQRQIEEEKIRNQRQEEKLKKQQAEIDALRQIICLSARRARVCKPRN